MEQESHLEFPCSSLLVLYIPTFSLLVKKEFMDRVIQSNRHTCTSLLCKLADCVASMANLGTWTCGMCVVLTCGLQVQVYD